VQQFQRECLNLSGEWRQLSIFLSCHGVAKEAVERLDCCNVCTS
jgi:hypothetical protein